MFSEHSKEIVQKISSLEAIGLWCHLSSLFKPEEEIDLDKFLNTSIFTKDQLKKLFRILSAFHIVKYEPQQVKGRFAKSKIFFKTSLYN